jgi:hypothetical protein
MGVALIGEILPVAGETLADELPGDVMPFRPCGE